MFDRVETVDSGWPAPRRSPRALRIAAGLIASAGLVASTAAADSPAPDALAARIPEQRAWHPMIDEGTGAESDDIVRRLLELETRDALAEGQDPQPRREALLRKIIDSPFCFVEFPTQEQLENIHRMYGGLPVGSVMAAGMVGNFGQPGGVNNRFVFIPNGGAWAPPPVLPTDLRIDPIGQTGRRIALTFSFPQDGVFWGLSPVDMSPQANELNAQIQALFGLPPTDPMAIPVIDVGRELIRASFAGWSRWAGIDFNEVGDDQSPLNPDPLTGQLPFNSRRPGDIRVGGFQLQSSFGVLAFNYAPVNGGDMTLNTTFFNSFYAQASNRFRSFRNAVAHELGHGLGLAHVVPCTQSKLMEPTLSTRNDTQQIDDIRGLQRHYGDRYSGNNVPAAAVDLGVLTTLGTTSPSRSAYEKYLSTNGAGDVDWFKFTVEDPTQVLLVVQSRGGSYSAVPQDPTGAADICTPADDPNDDFPDVTQAERTGDLALQIGTPDPNTGDPIMGTVINRQSPTDTSYPGVETLEINAQGGPQYVNLLPGTYYIAVSDLGNPDATAQQRNGVVQLYDLSIRVIDPRDAVTQVPFPPVAIAGVNKRCLVRQLCKFYGEPNSYAQEPGSGPLNPFKFMWDLDGDGTFETQTPGPTDPPLPPGQDLGNPYMFYDKNGIYPVTLKVTDTINGVNHTDTDTILVRVGGDQITVTSVVPPSGALGTLIPNVEIHGTNLGAIQDLSDIQFLLPGMNQAGNGVFLLGNPVVNATQDVISGLFLLIDPSATIGFRDVTVDDTFTTATLVNGFEVLPPLMPPPNDECNGRNAVATAWPDPGTQTMVVQTYTLPFDNTNATTSDTQIYPSTPCDGGVAYFDTWYEWKAPGGGDLVVSLLLSPPGTRVAVYTGAGGCPRSAVTLKGCATWPGTISIPELSMGERLIFRIGQSATTPTTGLMGNIDLTFTLTAGACCYNTGACLIKTVTQCAADMAMHQGAGVACQTNNAPCPQPVGACCTTSGCDQTLQSACTGVWTLGPCSPNPCPGACCSPSSGCFVSLQSVCAQQPINIWVVGTCSPNACPPTNGACCMPDLTCRLAFDGRCFAPDTFIFDGTCNPNSCRSGACCDTAGTCSFVQELSCIGDFQLGVACTPTLCDANIAGACCDLSTGGCQAINLGACPSSATVQFFPGQACLPNACPLPPPIPGSCCIPGGSGCRVVDQNSCPPGDFLAGGTCSPNPCPPPVSGACCRPGGICINTSQTRCATVGGTYRGDATACVPTTCGSSLRACCFPGGICAVFSPQVCTAQGGSIQSQSTCNATPCSATPLTGACCRGFSCVVTENTNCSGMDVFQGAATTCGAVGNPTTCCPANFNGVDGVTIQDVFEFLDAFGAGSMSADVNGDGDVGISDVSLFLDAYFAGCT